MRYRSSEFNLLFEVLFVSYGGIAYFFLWPFLAILIRLRAHYKPIQGALYLSHDPGGYGNEIEIVGAGDEDEEGDSRTSYGVNSNVSNCLLFMKRIKRFEGIGGVLNFQGIFPYIIYGLLEYITYDIEIFVIRPIRPTTVLPRTIKDVVGTLVFATIRLPILVFLYRATTSSRYVPITQMFSALLSPGERRNLFKLYLIPGLFASVLSLDMTYHCLILSRARMFTFRYDTPLDFTLLYGSILVITLLLCPLEVIIIRLALQKYRTTYYRAPSASELLSISDDEHESGGLQGQEGLRFLGSEDVVNLRGEIEPYKGLVDCARKIVREEGWNMFWRGWLIAFGINFLCDPDMGVPWYLH